MRLFSLTLLLIFILCISFSHSVAEENHSTRKPIRHSIEDVKDSHTYWDHRYRRYPYPYPNPYIYPYYPPYPPPPSFWRYKEYETSPYDNLSVKQAGRITIVAQPLDARVYVDGFQLKRKDDLTCEIGLLTGIHKIEVKREGYNPQTIDVLVEAGKSIPLTIELEKTKQ
jgi:hypothetical protein